MNALNRVHHSVNYAVCTANETLTAIVSDPSKLKKILEIAIKLFAAADLYRGASVQSRAVTEAMQGTVDLVRFRVVFQHLMFWVHPFSNESLDRKSLTDSLANQLPSEGGETAAARAERIVDRVIRSKSHYGEEELRQSLREELATEKVEPENQETLIGKLEIRKRARPLHLLLETACLTVANAGANAITLQKWGFIVLPPPVVTIGKFVLVCSGGLGSLFGVAASMGLAMALARHSYAAYELRRSCMEEGGADEKVLAKANSNYSAALMTVFDTGLDLVSTFAPLAYTFNPMTLVLMALLSKGVGLTRIFVYE